MKIAKIQNSLYKSKISPQNFSSRKIILNSTTPNQDTFATSSSTIKVAYDENGNNTDKICFNQGRKFSACKYNSNGDLIQTEYYETDSENKRYELTKWDSVNLFSIERNQGEAWKDYPSISLTIKNQKDFVKIDVQLPHSKMPLGRFSVVKPASTERPFNLFITLDGKYHCNRYSQEEIQEAISHLEKLKETMQNEEYKKDFGSNKKLNKALDSAITHLTSEL